MAVWYFGALFGILFSTFYFLYSPERMGSDRDRITAAAEMFSMCHRAAVNEARSNAALLAPTSASLNCSTASLSTASGGLSVSGIRIAINSATDVGGITGRIVTTYLLTGTAMNGVNFQAVRAQLGQRYQGEPTVGEVATVGGFQAINTVSTVIARVPATIPTGTLAMVTSVQP